MAALWRRGPLSFVSLIEEVKAGQPWADATIKTLLHRLMQKGAVKSVKEDGRQLYHPQITRDDYLDGEIGQLVKRLFGDDFGTFQAFLNRRSFETRAPDDPP